MVASTEIASSEINATGEEARSGPSRGLAVMALVSISIIVAVSIVWRPASASPSGDYFTLCGFKNLTGLPCPGCGLTHSFCALGKGNVGDAFAFNLLGPIVFVLLLLVWARAVGVLRGRIGFVQWIDRSLERFRLVKTVTLAFLVFGVARIVYILVFHSETLQSSPVARFISGLFR